MIDYAAIRLKETNFETREIVEELIGKIIADPHQTIDLTFISSFFEDFVHEDLMERTCGICRDRTDNCRHAKETV